MTIRCKRVLGWLLSLAVLLSALCVTVSAEQEVTFTDVSGHWAESAIGDAAGRGLVQGYGGLYRPDDSMTRAELVTVLWRAMGQPRAETPSAFTDLTQDWYREAVAWAQENGVVTGTGGDKFDPDGNVTREQLAAILYRLSGGVPGMEVLFIAIYDQHFTDEETAEAYARPAVYWCVFNVIYCGEASEEVGNALAPKADATRGQIAVMITRYLDRIVDQ